MKLEKFKVDEIPENLIIEEVKVLSQGMSEDEAKKNNKKFEETAKKRIKVGLILNEFGEQNKVNVSEQEVQGEVQKQLKNDARTRENGYGILSKKPICISKFKRKCL